MLRVQVAFSKCIQKLRLFFTSAFEHNLTLAAYSSVHSSCEFSGARTSNIAEIHCWAFRRYLRLERSCAVFHGTDNVWRTGLTSRSCKKRFSCTWDSLSILELSSLSSESSCGTNRLYRLDVEPSGNASSPTVTAQVAGISESLPCSSTWRKSEHIALDGFKMRSTVFTRGVLCMKAQVACKAEIYSR